MLSESEMLPPYVEEAGLLPKGDIAEDSGVQQAAEDLCTCPNSYKESGYNFHDISCSIRVLFVVFFDGKRISKLPFRCGDCSQKDRSLAPEPVPAESNSSHFSFLCLSSAIANTSKRFGVSGDRLFR